MSYNSAFSSEQSLSSSGRILVSVWFTFLFYLIGGNNLQANNFNSDGAGTGGNQHKWVAKQTRNNGGPLLADHSNSLGGGALSLGPANGDKDLMSSYAIATIPEAGTYVLVGFGLLIVGCVWRKRRA